MSWQRLSQANEGGPIPLSAIFLIALRLLELGLASAAFAVLLSEDGYLREDDWENLLIRDVSILRAHKDSPPQVGLLLGPSERGGTTKTGPDQGVIVDTPLLRWWIYYLAQLKDREESLVTLTSHEFRKIWWRTLDDLGLTYLGPPHSPSFATFGRRERRAGPRIDPTTGQMGVLQVRATVHKGPPPHQTNSPHGPGLAPPC